MRRSPRLAVVGALLLGAVWLLQEPVRHGTLAFLRLPLTLTRNTVELILILPQLPALSREHHRLQAALTQERLNTAHLRETLRQTDAAAQVLAMAPIHQGIVASVIGRSTLPVQQTVLLNKGERDGLSLESVIVHPSGVIGRVMALYPTTCLVMLLTDPDSRVAGLVERSRETGLLVGRGRGLCELIYLDARADINEGDQIVTAGLAGSFLKGVPLGTVTRVVRDEPSGSLSAFVAPAAHVSRLEDVLCLPARQ